MRLDKILSDAGHGSRKDAHNFIRGGRVAVDGAILRNPSSHIDPAVQTVFLDGEDIDWQPAYTLIMHKPPGVVSSTDEPGETTVIDLLPLRFRRLGLFPAGRLDKDTTGLLILTNDGALAHRLTAPAHHVTKRYLAVVDGALRPEHVLRFAKGITLADGTLCKPAGLEIVRASETSEAVVTLREGKYHQVRRMMASCGCPVLSLHRASIGALTLENLPEPGTWRKLTNSEISTLLCQTDLSNL